MTANRPTVFIKDITDQDKLSTEPNKPSDGDRKAERDTEREQTTGGEREADASASDGHKEFSELLKSLPPTESACQTNLSQLMVIS